MHFPKHTISIQTHVLKYNRIEDTAQEVGETFIKLKYMGGVIHLDPTGQVGIL